MQLGFSLALLSYLWSIKYFFVKMCLKSVSKLNSESLLVMSSFEAKFHLVASEHIKNFDAQNSNFRRFLNVIMWWFVKLDGGICFCG